MAIEIERRVLVRDPLSAYTDPGMTGWQRISQGYFGQTEGLRIRVRIVTEADGEDHGVLTLNDKRHEFCRLEYEYPLGALCGAAGVALAADGTDHPQDTLRDPPP